MTKKEHTGHNEVIEIKDAYQFGSWGRSYLRDRIGQFVIAETYPGTSQEPKPHVHGRTRLPIVYKTEMAAEKKLATMPKDFTFQYTTWFSVKLIRLDETVATEYIGTDSSQALNTYVDAFRNLLTQQGMKMMQCTIDDKPIDKFFDWILIDEYNA